MAVSSLKKIVKGKVGKGTRGNHEECQHSKIREKSSQIRKRKIKSSHCHKSQRGRPYSTVKTSSKFRKDDLASWKLFIISIRVMSVGESGNYVWKLCKLKNRVS